MQRDCFVARHSDFDRVHLRCEFSSRACAATDDAAITPPVGQLLITSRYAVGAKEALSGAATASALQIYLAQIEQTAKTATDQLRIVPVAGELLGSDEAIKRLDALKPRIAGTHLMADAASLRSIYTAGVKTLSESEVTRLGDDHGWFGSLALSFKQPPGDPLRRRVIHQAEMTCAAMIGLGVVAFIGLGIGVVLLILAIVRGSEGKIPLAYQRRCPARQPRSWKASPFFSQAMCSSA